MCSAYCTLIFNPRRSRQVLTFVFFINIRFLFIRFTMKFNKWHTFSTKAKMRTNEIEAQILKQTLLWILNLKHWISYRKIISQWNIVTKEQRLHLHKYTFGYQVIDRQQCEGHMDNNFLGRPLLGRIVCENYVP